MIGSRVRAIGDTALRQSGNSLGTIVEEYNDNHFSNGHIWWYVEWDTGNTQIYYFEVGACQIQLAKEVEWE